MSFRSISAIVVAVKADAAAAARVGVHELVIGPDRAHRVKTPVDRRRTLTLLPRTIPDMVAEGVLRAQHRADVRQVGLDRGLVLVHELAHPGVLQAFAAARIVRRMTVSKI